MAKGINLPAVLLIWGCSPPGGTLPTDSFLRPAQLEQHMGAEQLWTMSVGNEGRPELLLRSAAGIYTEFGRVDDELRVAPKACGAPVPPPPRLSASRDDAGHGKKLYYLFAKDRLAYLQAKDLDHPKGRSSSRSRGYQAGSR